MSLRSGVWYTIVNKATGTVADFSQSNFRSLLGYQLHGGPNQLWTLEDAGNGLWYIRSGSRGVYINIVTPQNHTDMICGSSKQAFKIIPDFIDSSLWRIVHPSTGYVLDLRAANPASGTGVCLYQSHNGRHQAWSFHISSVAFDSSNAPVFFLSNRRTNTVADLSTSNQRSVTGFAKAKASNQIWMWEEIDKANSLYAIKSADTGAYLGFDGSPSSSKALVAGSVKQTWLIRADPSDPFMIRIWVPNQNLLVDLTASNSANGTPLILYPNQNPGINQQWKVEPAQ